MDDIVKICHDRKEFGILEDGYYYYFPSGGGGLCSHGLIKIANELDRLNKDWDDIVQNDPILQEKSP